MRFSSILLAAVALAGPSYSTALDMRSAKAPTPPDLDYLFTATVDIAVPLPNIPILNNPEGVRVGKPSICWPKCLGLSSVVVFPIPSGTIAGPALDATITGGLAYPEFDGKGASAIEVALITIYGNTTDGYPFLAQVLGIGSSKRQSARLVRYAFIFGLLSAR